MLGLKRVASFDELLNKDKTFDLTRVKNLARSAIDFRNSFYNLPPEDNEVVGEQVGAAAPLRVFFPSIAGDRLARCKSIR